jgi:glutathione synthase/RimK-type ligase-like ATP-grasp enzyme
MKEVLVVLSTREAQGEVIFEEEPARIAYEGFSNLVKNKKKRELRIANPDDYDREEKVFKRGVFFDGKEWLIDEEGFRPLGIIDKMQSLREREYNYLKREIAANFPYINDPDFSLLFSSKLFHVLCFGDLIPRSFLISSSKDADFFLEKIESEKVVVKPLIGSGGEGVRIVDKKDLNLKELVMPVLFQEFIEADAQSIGMSGEIADLRVVFVGEEISYVCTRVARKGSLMTNFHQGAQVKILDKKIIPVEVLKIIEKIQKQLIPFRKKFFSLDFIFDKKGKTWLVEINTRPGIDLFPSDSFDVRDRFLEELIELLFK